MTWLGVCIVVSTCVLSAVIDDCKKDIVVALRKLRHSIENKHI